MKENTPNNIDFADNFPEEKDLKSPSFWKWGVFSFVAVFFISLLFTHAFLQRQVLISHIKKQMAYSIQALNQFGWDVAYDNVSFHAFPLFPLGEINNLKLYNKFSKTSWNCETIRFDNSILRSQKLQFELIGKQFLTLPNGVHKIELANQEFILNIDDNGEIYLLSFKLFNISVADIADIKQAIVLGNQISSTSLEQPAPSFKLAFEISDIKLNGLLNYPLSQDIRRIYLNSEIIGKINFTNNLRSDLREWLSKDGHWEIKDFNLSWSPLLLVGKGNLYLNETFKPILQLNTTSKALSVLIDDLEHKNWLDSKGVFVAKILLSGKSYKQDENDQYLTVSTPISVRDDALLIEKIAVKKFN